MNPQPITNWIDAGESQTQEFKSSFDKSCIETLVAFANANPVKPVSTKGRYYKRVANTNQALNANQISDLYMQSLQLSWDAYPAHNARLEDLSMAKVDKFVQQVNAGGRFALGTTDALTALQKLNYTSQGQPTWAAMLLFAQVPLRHHIHIGRFKTASLIIDDRQITDTLFEAVDQAMRFIVSYVPVAFEITGAIHRTERFAYPLPALREALLNAVVHREYKDGSDIQVKIFNDSISIFSPGTFYGGLSVAEVQGDSYRSSLRNKLVAEAFYLTTAIEKYGSGFIRIRQALQDYPEIRFEVAERFGGVMVTFSRTQPESQPESLAQRILQALALGPLAKKGISTALGQKEISGALNKTIRQLLQQQRIEYTLPEKPNSRQQQYRLAQPLKTTTTPPPHSP